MINRNHTDLTMTEDGDLFLSDKRDLDVTYNNKNELLLEIITRRFQSSNYDWNIDSVVTSNIDYVRGFDLNNNLVDYIIEIIASTLVDDFLIKRKNIFSDGVIESDNKINFVTIIQLEDSYDNEFLNLNFSYDLRQNRFVPRFTQGDI